MSWFWGSYTSKPVHSNSKSKPEPYFNRIKREEAEKEARKLKMQEEGTRGGIPFLLLWGLWFIFIICRWCG